MKLLLLSFLLGGALVMGGTAHAGKRARDVDWSQYLETPADRAKWEQKSSARRAAAEKATKSQSRSSKSAKKAKATRGKKAMKGKKGKKAKAAARKKRSP